jgi:hypothetical protein
LKLFHLTLVIGLARIAGAADLHPIVEVQSGYLFGAVADGKWIKADEATKSMADETTYRVYGLTQSLGEVKGGKSKNEDVPCEETRSVALRRAECLQSYRGARSRRRWENGNRSRFPILRRRSDDNLSVRSEKM